MPWTIPNLLLHDKPVPLAQAQSCPPATDPPAPTRARIRAGLNSARGKERSGLPRLLFENPLHHAGADAERSADLENAVSVGSQLQYARLDRGLNPTPAQLRTFRPSASKTRVYSFANDPTLELG